MVGRLIVWVMLGLGALATAAAAGARQNAYHGPAVNVQEQVSSGGGGERVRDRLPFTGLDLALIVGASLLLILVGIGIRRLNSRQA